MLTIFVIAPKPCDRFVPLRNPIDPNYQGEKCFKIGLDSLGPDFYCIFGYHKRYVVTTSITPNLNCYTNLRGKPTRPADFVQF